MYSGNQQTKTGNRKREDRRKNREEGKKEIERPWTVKDRTRGGVRVINEFSQRE